MSHGREEYAMMISVVLQTTINATMHDLWFCLMQIPIELNYCNATILTYEPKIYRPKSKKQKQTAGGKQNASRKCGKDWMGIKEKELLYFHL